MNCRKKSLSVRFVSRGFSGLKLAGLSPTKCHASEPRKQNNYQEPGKNPNSDSHIPPSLLRGFLPGHIMFEIPYSDVIKGISIILWPGKKPGASWEEYGSPRFDFCGAPGTNF